MKPCSLAKLLHAFFYEWMGQQRNLSRHTVLSYRDTWKLLLRFVAERKRREVPALSLSDLGVAEVLAFCNTWRTTGKYPSAPGTVVWLPSTASSPSSRVANHWRSRSAPRLRVYRLRR